VSCPGLRLKICCVMLVCRWQNLEYCDLELLLYLPIEFRQSSGARFSTRQERLKSPNQLSSYSDAAQHSACSSLRRSWAEAERFHRQACLRRAG